MISTMVYIMVYTIWYIPIAAWYIPSKSGIYHEATFQMTTVTRHGVTVGDRHGGIARLSGTTGTGTVSDRGLRLDVTEADSECGSQPA
jgi:hypothetical protein